MNPIFTYLCAEVGCKPAGMDEGYKDKELLPALFPQLQNIYNIYCKWYNDLEKQTKFTRFREISDSA